MIRWLVFDVDGTLFRSRVADNYESWARSVVEDPPKPVRGARSFVKLALAMFPRARRLVLTARPASLYYPTAKTLLRYFPELDGAILSTRDPLDTRRPIESKVDRLARYRATDDGRAIILEDEDLILRALVGKDDAGLLAPYCYADNAARKIFLSLADPAR